MTKETVFWIGLQIMCFSLIVGCSESERQRVGESIADVVEPVADAWQERNVRVQLRIVPQFQEVWYKGHLYVFFSSNAARQAALTHAGHCTGEHAEAVGY